MRYPSVSHVAVLLCFLLYCGSRDVGAQVQTNEVVGVLTGGITKYYGEFNRDMFGIGGQASIQYAPHRRMILETRFGYGTYDWKLAPSDLIAHPEYFGAVARIGWRYPGTATRIQHLNSVDFYSADMMVGYVVVPDIPAAIAVMGGVGLFDWNAQDIPKPRNGTSWTSIPSAAVSVPVGLMVRIPLLTRVSLVVRGEHRFVLSPWLDGVHFNSHDDGLSTGMVGLSYSFTAPPATLRNRGDLAEEQFAVPADDGSTPCELSEACMLNLYADNEECCLPCCGHSDCPPCCCHTCWCSCCHCCCCCCSCHSDAPAPAPAPQPADPKPEVPPEASGPEAPMPEPPQPVKPARKFSKDIRFKLDTDEFDFSAPQTQANLDELLDYMKSAPSGHEVIIEGHASSEGNPKRNQVLSDMRARKIKQWLIENGVEAQKIRGTVGYGSSAPKVLEPSPEQAKRMTPEEIERIRAQNRRIDVYVLKDGYEQDAAH